jgi:AcrR family transcriptional regulator
MSITAKPRRRPRQYRSMDTVDRILDAARSLLARVPYQEVNTKRIAAEPGMSVGALYAYFPDKASIVDRISERHIMDVRRRLENEVIRPALRERREKGLDAGELFRRTVELYAAYLEEHPDFRCIELGRDANETRMLKGGFARNGLTELLRNFSYQGVLDSSYETKRKLRVASEAGEGLAAYAYQQPTREQREQVFAELTKMLVSYLGPELGKPPSSLEDYFVEIESTGQIVLPFPR